MRTIALFSLSGAPGVTTLALAVAAAWPTVQRAVLVEADASGGDVASWRHLPASPGLVELAAAARAPEPADGALQGCVQVLPGGVGVCPAPASADRAAGAVNLLARRPAVLAPPEEAVAVVDVGRLAPRSAAAHLAAAADAAVLVVADDTAQLKRARDALPGLRAGIGRLGLAVVGGTNPRAQIVEALEAPVWARIPTDPRSAAFLRGEGGARRAGRRPLLAGARRLAQALTATAVREQAVSTP
ncbi:hypothetical protein [Nocardiopsis composta]|uniref:MinD-like ATPase involved in chromosome partitioning or flagellar assembly n=1 Tax=Nocardiopsis composta TaxID=157465 RepID=A0A7W8VBH5_9ACTN|nr:hypothetical protein [Nocardiopsis composta]MBB5429925.1 MinD-like ATPase involved in chromosome partitioning or flagellar assembly [Nocardiopsis composta]